MIGSLSGVLEEILTGAVDAGVELVISVGGVGYRVSVNPRTAAGIGQVGDTVNLKVHTHVREGAITLYGFSSSIERAVFEILIAAHGIGPGLALSILAVHDPATLATVIANSDLDALMAVPGVGRKTAQRLVVELGGRFDQLAGGALGTQRPLVSGAIADLGRPVRDPQALVVEALVGLGYSSDEASKALASLDETDRPVEELLRLALVALAPIR